MDHRSIDLLLVVKTVQSRKAMRLFIAGRKDAEKPSRQAVAGKPDDGFR